ncbi:MAG: hypothetical protein Kow0020_16140 [Wenzhouxiangellaceae bacterium]
MIRGVFAAWSLCCIAAVALADEQPVHCYAGGADSGKLEFRFALDGREFDGHFNAFSVHYCMPEADPGAGNIEVEVELDSVETGNRERDSTLRGPDFFDVAAHPVSRWRSTEVTALDSGGWRADGVLELKGREGTQAIRFDLSEQADRLHLVGRFTMTGEARVHRLAFDVGTGEFADPDFIRDAVDVRFDVRLSRD